jgi:hypothetical protein
MNRRSMGYLAVKAPVAGKSTEVLTFARDVGRGCLRIAEAIGNLLLKRRSEAANKQANKSQRVPQGAYVLAALREAGTRQLFSEKQSGIKTHSAGAMPGVPGAGRCGRGDEACPVKAGLAQHSGGDWRSRSKLQVWGDRWLRPRTDD